MKLAVNSEQRDFFRKQEWIQFEELLSPQQQKLLLATIDQTLASRLALPIERLSTQSPAALFAVGRDLWRADSQIRKIVSDSGLAGLAADLMEKKGLRLAYDQYFAASDSLKGDPSSGYAMLFERPITLEEMSAIQGVNCVLILCVDEGKNPVGELPESMLFPCKRGAGTFLKATTEIDFQQLLHLPQQRYLMIVYANPTLIYIQREGDPHLHALKQLGYHFGDTLSEKTHPTLVR
jgi:hypothetical protein